MTPTYRPASLASIKSVPLRSRIVLACLLLVGFLFLLTVRSKELAPLFYQPFPRGLQALIFYELGDYSKAAKIYRAQYQEMIESGKTTHDPGLDAFLRGDLALAQKLTRQLLDKDPDNIPALMMLGEIALEQGSFEDAKNFSKQVLRMNPKHGDALVLAAVAYTRTGASGEALDFLNRVLRIGEVGARLTTFLNVLETTGDLAKLSEDKIPLCLLAHYYRYLRIYDESNGKLAIRFAEKAITAGDRPADAYLTIGIVYEKRRRPQKALEAFTMATEVNPAYAMGYRWAAVVYSKAGYPQEYEYLMRKAAVKADPADDYLLDEYYNFLLTMKDYYLIVTSMEKTLASNPQNLSAHVYAGRGYELLGEPLGAKEHYEHAVKLVPESPMAYEGKLWALQQLGKFDEMEPLLQEAIKIAPQDSTAHRSLANLYRQQGRNSEAVKQYDLVLLLENLRFQDRFLESLQIEERYDICYFYYKNSEFQRAETCVDPLLRMYPANPRFLKFREAIRAKLIQK